MKLGPEFGPFLAVLTFWRDEFLTLIGPRPDLVAQPVVEFSSRQSQLKNANMRNERPGRQKPGR